MHYKMYKMHFFLKPCCWLVLRDDVNEANAMWRWWWGIDIDEIRRASTRLFFIEKKRKLKIQICPKMKLFTSSFKKNKQVKPPKRPIVSEWGQEWKWDDGQWHWQNWRIRHGDARNTQTTLKNLPWYRMVPLCSGSAAFPFPTFRNKKIIGSVPVFREGCLSWSGRAAAVRNVLISSVTARARTNTHTYRHWMEISVIVDVSAQAATAPSLYLLRNCSF